MSTRIIGRAREGRRIASNATGAGTVKVVEFKAPIGDGTTADSATPFLKFTGTQDTSEDGSNNMSSANVTTGVTPVGVLIETEGTRYWLALYPLS
jgi:hypothetical protein